MFGPRQDPTSQYSGVLSIFMKSILTGEAPTIFGDGEQSRDFTYVEDVVALNLKAAHAPQDVSGKVFNAGNGGRITLNQAWELVQKIEGKTLAAQIWPPRAGDVRDSQADTTAAAAELGHAPQFSFEEGMRLDPGLVPRITIRSRNCYTGNLQTQKQLSSSQENLLQGYDLGAYYDEMFEAPGVPRPHYQKVMEGVGKLAPVEFEDRRQLADLAFLLQGITFTVYSDGRGTERLFPFDLMPRILPRSQWDKLEAGLSQRVLALNLFLQDIYGAQRDPEGQADPALPGSFLQAFPARNDRRQGSRGTSTRTSPASTWCAIPEPASSGARRQRAARPAASPTSSKTVWS